MKERHRTSLPLFSTRLTAIVSVTLVLLVLGATAMLGIGGASLADDIRSSMGFVVIMDEEATPADVNAMKQRLLRATYAASTAYASPADVLARWQSMIGNDENLAELTDGVNPFAPEFEVNVKPRWADADSLRAIADRLEMIPAVAEVKVHTEMISQVNRTVRTVAFGAAIVAGVLLLISFVLINNTVRLTIYSRRYIIHTMKLVGATGGFIRRPIVRANMLAGLLASLMAVAILAGLLAWLHSLDAAFIAAIPWQHAAWVFGAMIAAGVLLCWLASTLATNKYLRAGSDDLFK